MTDTRDPKQFDNSLDSSIPSTHSVIELCGETLVYDRENPDRWIQASESVSLDECR
ncbi:hypothetical protein [Natrinema sp. 1APR25-10V2]|uniref:DUF7331 family protein n=1 Tax=Natrinema sp. 1APR25-10V2 TaxID=2951081 RepID=UPI0028764839|nr:hypothetical protein [Natrinema sp. 1APR25-10V2]MDS0473438.1 hypothetical protein [Natrinema sp. 1APR25-10V2]